MNKKIAITILIIIALFSIIVFAQSDPETMLIDSFEDGNQRTNNWSVSATAGISFSLNNPRTGSFNIFYDSGSSTDATANYTVDIDGSSYSSCLVTSYIEIASGMDTGEYMCMDYSVDGGSTWNNNTGGGGTLCIDGNVDTEGAYQKVVLNITSPTSQMRLRFRGSASSPNEDGYADDVNVTCYSFISPNIPPVVTLNSPANNSNLDLANPHLLNVSVLDDDSDPINVTFVNASNDIALCQNDTITSGNSVVCGVTLAEGDEVKWYVNITDNSTIYQNGTWNFSINVADVDAIFDITHSNVDVTSDFNISRNNWTGTFTVSGGGSTVFNTTWYNGSDGRDALVIMDFNKNSSNNVYNLLNNGTNGSISGSTVTFENFLSRDGSGYYRFNPTAGNSRIIVPVDVRGYTEISFGGWVLWNGSPTTNTGLFSWRSTNFGLSLVNGAGDDGVRCNLANESDLNPTIGVTSAFNNPPNTWTHVFCTWSATDGLVKLYVNGVNVANSSTQLGNELNYSAFGGFDAWIGERKGGGTENLNGTVDDFLVYNYELTPQQIMAIYQDKTHVLVSQETGIGENWTFNVVSSNSTGHSDTSSKSFNVLSSCDTNFWDATENCEVTGLDAGGNTVTCTGAGTITVTGDVTNGAVSPAPAFLQSNGCNIIYKANVPWPI